MVVFKILIKNGMFTTVAKYLGIIKLTNHGNKDLQSDFLIVPIMRILRLFLVKIIKAVFLSIK